MGSVLAAWGLPAAVIGAIVLLVAMPKIVAGVAILLKWIFWPFRYLSPALYTEAARKDGERRRRLARLLQGRIYSEPHLQYEMTRYTDIRATIEAVDTPYKTKARLFGIRRSTSVYRTRSLTKALARESDILVNLQGPAGSGKSVAMRHFAFSALAKAQATRLRNKPLAVYVNLRDFDTPPADLTVGALLDYIVRQVDPQETPELNQYLKQDLQKDIQDGLAIMLFDSFDEIPSILPSASIDSVVKPYIDVISNLMGGGKAKCVVASRVYHSPRRQGWTRLNLAGLSPGEQQVVLRAHGLTDAQLAMATSLLTTSVLGFVRDLRNPLSLSLLAQYIAKRNEAPKRPSELYESYVHDLLQNMGYLDKQMIDTALLLLQDLAAKATEKHDSGLLLPDAEIRRRAIALIKLDAEFQPEDVVSLVLRSGLLVRATPVSSAAVKYAFVHRRVLEYFATQYLISHPGFVPNEKLATQPQWRETAVALLQISKAEEARPLLDVIAQALRAENELAETSDSSSFEWSPRAVHLLELLVAASEMGASVLTEEIQQEVSGALSAAWERGGISDRKLALDALLLAAPEQRQDFIERAFAGRSAWLRLSALRCCDRLTPLPMKINLLIRQLLSTLLAGGQLRSSGRSLDGDLGRLYEAGELVRTRRLLAFIPYGITVCSGIKIAFNAAHVVDPLSIFFLRDQFIFWIVMPVILFWAYQASQPVSFEVQSRTSRYVERVGAFFFRASQLESELVWLLVCMLTLLNVVFHIVVGILPFFLTSPTVWHFTFLIGAPITTWFLLLWGPAALHQLRYRTTGGQTGWVALAFGPFVLLPKIARDLWEIGREVVSYIVFSLLLNVAFAAAAFGLFWLIGQIGGAAEEVVRVSVQILLLGLLPVFIVGYLVREGISHYRVVRSVRRTAHLTEAAFLDEIVSLKDSTTTAEYIRAVRIDRADASRAISPVFLQRLIHAIESAQAGTEDVPISTESDDPPVVRVISHQKLLALAQSPAVLDDLGLLTEFLRER